MSDLISGKEAKLAWANGEYNVHTDWHKLGGATPLSIFDRVDVVFRLKPRTITINGIEVPAPFKPKDGDLYWHISPEYMSGYGESMYSDGNVDTWQQFGAWRNEEEIKQVVAALRSIFNAT